MRWFLISCFLLATATDVLSGHRTKRDLSFIKNFIASKLFGTDTIVIQQPELPNNESYQLFKIKGYDNILLKVMRKPNKHEDKEEEPVVPEKVYDPVIVSPEIAIIGNYLGTSTQGETLLALEIAKNLVKSGVLRGEREKYLQEAVVPMKSQIIHKNYVASKPVKTVSLIAEKKNPVYFVPSINGQVEKVKIENHDPVSVQSVNPQLVSSVKYPSFVVASDIYYRPLQTKYSYKQKGDNADMVYESYNNQDVIVTRTDKEPPLPQYIKLRIAEVASLGANPFLIRSQQPVTVIPEEHVMQPINLVSGSYDYLNPSVEVRGIMQPVSIPTYMINRLNISPKPVGSLGEVQEVGYVRNNNNDFVSLTDNKTSSSISDSKKLPSFINTTKLRFDIRDHLSDAEVDKINRFINEKLKASSNNENNVTLNITSSNYNEENLNKNEKEIVNEGQKVHQVSKEKIINNHMATKHLYKNFNHRSRDNYTVVNHENPRKVNQSNPSKTNKGTSSDVLPPKDFVYVPPKQVSVPMPNMIPKTNNMQNQNHTAVRISSSSKNYTNSLILAKPGNVNEAPKNTQQLKVSGQNSLKKNPIVVIDDKSDKETFESGTDKIQHASFRPYVGGPVF